MLEIVKPLSNVLRSITKAVLPFSLRHVMTEVPTKTLPVTIDQYPEPFNAVFLPFTLKLAAIAPRQIALALSLSLPPFSLIEGTITVKDLLIDEGSCLSIYRGGYKYPIGLFLALRA